MTEPQQLGASLARLVGGLTSSSAKMIDLLARWEEVVGESLAAHSRPVRIDGAVLIVEVDDPRWATQMKFSRSAIHDAVATICNVVVDRIEVKVGRLR
ncbi:MAG: DUF721 domain-containing protein [Actinomycetia bacterium]|nr:DUF721 domain-containing protein [Actinomycetes bacterium]